MEHRPTDHSSTARTTSLSRVCQACFVCTAVKLTVVMSSQLTRHCSIRKSLANSSSSEQTERGGEGPRENVKHVWRAVDELLYSERACYHGDQFHQHKARRLLYQRPIDRQATSGGKLCNTSWYGVVVWWLRHQTPPIKRSRIRLPTGPRYHI